MTAPHITIDTRWSIGILITLLVQLGSFIWFISKLDSRILALENSAKQSVRFPLSEGKLLEQKLIFYIDTLTEIKSDLKQIKESVLSK
jgi:hypothetical protein